MAPQVTVRKALASARRARARRAAERAHYEARQSRFRGDERVLDLLAGVPPKQCAALTVRYLHDRYPLRGPGVPFGVSEQRRETWVDRDWRGHEIVHRGRIVDGRRGPEHLLHLANSTPELRAGLWGVLALAPGVERAPELRDPLGRPGEAITIPNPAMPSESRLAVIFDAATSAPVLLGGTTGQPGAAHDPAHGARAQDR